MDFLTRIAWSPGLKDSGGLSSGKGRLAYCDCSRQGGTSRVAVSRRTYPAGLCGADRQAERLIPARPLDQLKLPVVRCVMFSKVTLVLSERVMVTLVGVLVCPATAVAASFGPYPV